MESKSLHDCSIHDLEDEWGECILYGGAVFECLEGIDGKLFVNNGEYGSRVNYCPYCGYKAKNQMKMKSK